MALYIGMDEDNDGCNDRKMRKKLPILLHKNANGEFRYFQFKYTYIYMYIRYIYVHETKYEVQVYNR